MVLPFFSNLVNQLHFLIHLNEPGSGIFLHSGFFNILIFSRELFCFVVAAAIIAGIGLFALLSIRKFTVKSTEIEARNKQLTKAIEEKNRFFSIIAHDLKSPFNSLLGLSEMLTLHSETVNNKEIRDYSKMMHQTTVKLYTLVDELLQWSQAQMGSIKYLPAKLDINILITNTINLLKLAAQDKDIVIALKLDNGLIAFADSNIFSSVLRNLVNNAIKFSPVGSTIQVKGRLTGKGYVEVEVKDYGVGMSREQIEKAFNLDDLATTTGTFNEKGTGLGLILCKEFVEINKGTISISSFESKGTSVIFSVPVYQGQESDA